MHSPDLSAPCYPGEAALERLRVLLNEGRALDAWALAREFAPLSQWVKAGPLPAFYASRLYAWLGNPRRGDAIDRVARRLYPDSPEVFLRALNGVGRRQGYLAMLELILDEKRHPPMEERHRFFLINREGDLWTMWSDFDRAQACYDRADALRPGHDRTLVDRAATLIRADRRVEAEGLVREAMRVRPGNVSAPRMLAELLRDAGREDEAREVLEAAMERVQDGDIVLALANWHSEHGQYAEALRLSDEYEKLVPLANASGRRWLAGWRSFRHYLAKDYDAALQQAALCPKGFIGEIADRLREPEPGRRVRLAVPFVKQDRRTCAPATLAALCRFHGDAAEQVEIAEAICYDGTPDHSERHWVEERGYAVREFRVTPETVRALIDLELPFTLTTVEPASAHLQAVIGYDTKADTLLVREPGWADDAEYRMAILKDYAFSGPRGMVMVPRGKENLLEGLSLPEVELYDFLHGLQRALHENDRAAAIGFLEKMRAADAGHRLTILGERRLAAWDRNVPGQLDGVDRMLALYPDQPALLYEKLWLLASTAGRREQMDFARRVQASGKAPSEVDRMVASLLDDDAREWPAAQRAWRRAMRRSGLQSATVSGLADFRWSQGRRREAVLCYRLAACVEVLAEGPARSYFNAARWVGPGEGEECLGFLQKRVERFGARSGGPARTLAWALDLLGRNEEALEVMEAAVARRPAEGELLLAAADFFRDAGRTDRAAELVAQAEHRVPDGTWWRRMAREAVGAADLPKAIGYYRRLLESEPASREVHGALANLLAGTEGRMAAAAHLEAVCARYPGHADLHELWCDWLEEDLAARDAVLRHLLRLNPANAWARRELAIDLRKQGKHDEAVREAREAMAVAPKEVASAGILGGALQGAYCFEEARECFRQALRLDVDYAWGISELIGLAPDLAEKRRELEWIRTQLEEQVTDGNGLMRWRSEAWLLQEPEEILEVLKKARGVRPDLWQSWTVLGMHLADMGRMDEALEVSAEAAERFPFLPRVWYDLALIRGRRGDGEGERAALEQALALSPRWELAVRRMAAVCRNLNDAAEARTVLERHARSSPSDAGPLLDLVRLLRDEGDAVAAREACRRAVLLTPLSEEAWRLRASLATGDAEQMEVVRAEAAALTGRLPHSLAAWECRSAVASTEAGYEAELKVLDEGLAALAGSWDLLDRKALLLSECGRYDEAVACCAPGRPGAAENRWRLARVADILYRQGQESEAVRQMESLAEEHPDYAWPVQRLVEWFDHWADHEAVLKWSVRQTRLNPGQHAGWGYQAGALLALDRQEEAETALRKAVALEPGYTWAVKQLLTLELKRGDLAAAEKTVARVRGRIAIPVIAGLYTGNGFAEQAEAFCRSAVELNAQDAASHEALGEALWTLDRRPEAVEAWLSAVQLKPEELGRLTALHEKAGTADLLEEVRTRLRDWAAEDPPKVEKLDVWLTFLSKDEDPKLYLAALTEAMRRLPEHMDFPDRKAARLALLHRYTEALEVCGTMENVVLLRRRAWIEAERGNRVSAIDLMGEALKKEEDSVFGLQKICDWLEDADRAAEAVPYAEKLVRVAPWNATSFGFLASALLRCKRKAEAEPHLFRALRMMNSYEWAADRLFDLQLDRDDHEAAEVTLRIVREHQAGDGALLKELRLAISLRDQARGSQTWEKLVRASPAASKEVMEEASRILNRAGWGSVTMVVGNQGETDGDFTQGMGAGAYAVWVKEEYGRKNHTVWKRFAALPDEALRAEAWIAYLDAVGDSPGDFTIWDDLRKWKTRWAIHRNRDYLRSTTELWAAAVYFYVSCRLWRAGRRWSADWRSRGGLRSWMLSNVATLLDGNGTPRRSREVREWCVANLAADHTTASHRSRLAFLAAVEGNKDMALTYLSDLKQGDVAHGPRARATRFQLDLARLMCRWLDGSQPMDKRRRQAATDLAAAIVTAGGVLDPSVHGSTLRVFLPFALRRAGFSNMLWQSLKLIPTACGLG